MRVVFCWPEISGYIAACWRALVAEPGIEVFIIAYRSGTPGSLAAFDDSVVSSLPIRLLEAHERDNTELIISLAAEQNPDVIVLPGWGIPAYSRIIKSSRLADKRFVMFMDTPLKNTWRQRFGRLKFGRYIDRMDAVMVTGERSWQFARTLLKVPETKLHRGTYGIDYDSFATALPRRLANPGGWPKSFLYMGRFAQVKGLDVLVDAYRQYRSMVKDPWPLTCHGNGPLASLLKGEGITAGGFVQPSEQPQLMSRHGVFIMPSTYDPWPLVIVEACAAGMPVICTNACGSAVELLRSHFNGMLVPTANAKALAQMMRWVQDNLVELPEMGRRGQNLAAAYSAQMWARRWAEMIRDIGQNESFG